MFGVNAGRRVTDAAADRRVRRSRGAVDASVTGLVRGAARPPRLEARTGRWRWWDSPADVPPTLSVPLSALGAGCRVVPRSADLLGVRGRHWRRQSGLFVHGMLLLLRA